MISKTLHALKRGLHLMRMSTRMLLVGVLVFVFPLLFLWVNNSSFEFAYNSIDTSEKLRIGMLHDTLEALVLSGASSDLIHSNIQKVIDSTQEDQIKVTDIRLYKETAGNFVVLNAYDKTLVGTTTDTAIRLLKNAPFSEKFDFHSADYQVGGAAIRQSYQRITVPDGYVYILSEQDRTSFERIIQSRKETTYLILSVIFVFLIILAVWLKRQMFWEAQYEKLQEKMHERDLFFNVVAHEFRSPLTAIKGYASFLQEAKTLKGDQAKFVSNIYTSAERLVVLVGDFLEISRIQSGKLSIAKEQIDLRNVLSQVTDNLKVLATEKGLSLSYKQTQQPILFETDPARMKQVLTNVITNAIKYTENGAVELECKKDIGCITIRIKDTGMGISAEDQQRLFAPFTRVGGVDSTSIKGTGLGMWITKQLVELLGGTIGVESIKNVGTHVVITFKTKLR